MIALQAYRVASRRFVSTASTVGIKSSPKSTGAGRLFLSGAAATIGGVYRLVVFICSDAPLTVSYGELGKFWLDIYDEDLTL